jgi:antitoxin (DNA-binding transcriptional repressor) of toxin-antitoxin stability system
METFAARDLCECTGDLICCAEAGKLSVVTKHGGRVFFAVPFDGVLVREGVTTALAVHLLDEEHVSQGEAAQLAGMTHS